MAERARRVLGPCRQVLPEAFVVFETTSACHPSLMNSIKVPQVAFNGLDEDLFAASGGGGNV